MLMGIMFFCCCRFDVYSVSGQKECDLKIWSIQPGQASDIFKVRFKGGGHTKYTNLVVAGMCSLHHVVMMHMYDECIETQDCEGDVFVFMCSYRVYRRCGLSGCKYQFLRFLCQFFFVFFNVLSAHAQRISPAV